MMAGVPRSNPARWGLLLLVRLGAGGALYAQTVAVDDVAVMRMLCRKTQPEWSDAQLDSAAAAWTQWSAQGAPRNAEALAVLWPDQQFALERYQAQFGWPRDSTEWRAIALSGIQRELLQRLYHGARSRSHTPGRSGLALREPLFSVGWTASDALQGAWTARRLGSGAQLGLVGATSSLGIVPWSIRSPSDEVLRGWAEPGSYALALQPGKARAGAPRLLRDVERLALGRSASSTLLGEVAVRRVAWAAAAGLGAGGWWLLQGSWHGPGGLLVQVQREGFRREAKGLGWVRPGADATPWRALRGNRATAAVPLWAGRLTLAQTPTGRSATWADRQTSVAWIPGHVAMGRYLNLSVGTDSTATSLRGLAYLGRAQGASLQLRHQSRSHIVELGLASITSRDAVFPRALGPMSLWRPGLTGEAAWTFRRDANQASIRIRRSPSGWSASLRARWSLD